MKVLRQLGFLKINLGHEVPPEEDHRVLTLFRNRAELKKAYGELQDEVFRLKDRIKQQEGATARVQELLAELEERLGVPETAYPTLVFYQLRRLWQAGHDLLAQFTSDLARQQEERERKQHLAEHNRRLFAERQAAEKQLRLAEHKAADASARLLELETQRARLTRFWHYFRRRRLEREITAAQATAAGAGSGLAAARAAMAAIEAQPLPEFPGLSVEARRAINLAAISYSEVLCLRLARTPLVSLAREATNRRTASDEYGARAECEALMLQIDRAHALIQARPNIAQEIKARTERLRQVARYRTAADTAPTSESVAFSEGDALAVDPVGAGVSQARMPNVLAEDIWNLYSILLR